MKKTIISIILLVTALSVFAQASKPQWTAITSTSPESFQTRLLSSSENSVRVNVQVPGFFSTSVTTPRGEAHIISVPKSVSTAHAGEPDLPMTGVPVMIGDKARMDVRFVDAQYMDFENVEVAPSKGDFSRQVDPAKVPYTYGECYRQDAFFPASNLGLYDPYIIRDFRGQNMAIFPFAYNPVSKTLRVYYNMTVEMYKVDDKGTNTIESRRGNDVRMSSDFKSVYQRHFINFDEGLAKYTPLDEEGDLLIICYDNFISSMTDFVNWKRTRGVNTTIVGTSTAGSTYSAIQTYIRNQYNANNNLTHVLLVGDVAQIPGYSYSGGGSSYSGLGDNAYGQIVGNDIYNDLFIGRFSASTAARVTTQCNRVITYERDLTTSDTWLKVAEGIAKKEGGSGHNNEDDYQHMDNIRTDLLNYGYSTVYQRYANLSGYTATAAQISADINDGVGIINYTNHGAETMWGVASYSNTQVNALTNENKLPFIWSVACLVGKYDHSSDCFAEAWMNATNDNKPTGAVGALMSYISQPWVPPMWAHDECIDILCELKANNIKHTWGGTSINGLFGIFDNYSTSEQSAVGTYQAWILYGDPSMMLRTKTPETMTVSHNGTIILGANTYTVNVNNGNDAVATLTDANHNILGKATVSNNKAIVTLNGSNLTPGAELTLCVFGYNKVTYLGTVQVVANDAPFIIADSYSPTSTHVGDETDLNITFKNMGNLATSGTTTVTLSSTDTNVTIGNNNTKTFGSLASNATTTVSGFKFTINSGVADATEVSLHYQAVNGSNTWEGDMTVTATAPALEYRGMSWDGSFVPGQTLTVNAKFKNIGHYQATHAMVEASSNSNYVSFGNSTVNVGTIAVDQEITIPFTITIANNCPESSQLPISFTLTADGNLNVIGTETLKNTCYLYFDLADSYGDGWNNASLNVSFNDGTAAQTLTFTSGNSANYTIEVGNGTHVTLTWTNGSYDSECSFTVSYDGDLVVYQTNGTPSAGVLYEFDCNCAAATAVFTVDVNTSNGGSVTGGGEFTYGQSCTVVATANEGYYFASWTNNGTVVSTAPQYTFNVTSDMNLVANFIQAVEIGTASSTNNYLPTYNYYKYSFTEQIYTAQEIGVAGTINSIAFYNEGSEKTRTLDLYVKSTTKSTFSSKTDWVSMSNSDKVFSGSVTFTAGAWTFINFTTPFEYDGTSNIIIAVDDNTGEYTNTPHMACSVFNGSSQAIYIYSDGTNYSPSSPTTSQSSGYDLLSVKNHVLMGIEANTASSYDITVSANPATGGTVTGEGTYDTGATATLTATANEGYTFTNWTKNGNVVSSNPSYSFTVNAANSGAYIANFTLNSYTVTASAEPAEYGTVSVGTPSREELVYDFEDGWQGWTTFQGNTTSPNSWMHNTAYPTSNNNFSTGYGYNNSDGFMLSESYISGSSSGSGQAVTPDNYLVSPQVRLGGSISFYAGARNTSYCAEKFSVMVSTTDNANPASFTTVGTWTLSLSSVGYTSEPYTVDLSEYSGMGYIAIRHFDCYDQWFLAVDNVTIVEGPDNSTGSGNFNHGETCVVTATPNEGYYFINWTENGNVVSSNASYSFTVTADRDLVANFDEEPLTSVQTFELTSGSNWWGTNLNITKEQLQEAIANALGTSGTAVVRGETGIMTYANGTWRGSLTFDVSQMYMITLDSSCEIVLEGVPVNPDDLTITIHKGTNWIAFPNSMSLSVSEAFVGLNPVAGDIVKSEGGSTSFNGTSWRGSLKTLEPGNGYIYISNDPNPKTFTFPANQ